MCIKSLNKDFVERKKNFDSIFGTDTLHELHIDFDNMKLLKAIFQYFDEDIYKPSPKYEALRKQSIAKSNELEKTLTEKQQQLFEEYWEIQNKLIEEEEEQLFMFGFITSKALEKETNLITKEKTEN